VFQQTLWIGGTGEEYEEQEVTTVPFHEGPDSKRVRSLFFVLGMLLLGAGSESAGHSPISLEKSLDQTCAAPPSTNSSLPVTKADSSEARNNAAFAISSTSAILPSGTEETT
jgi:hypothetical protein